MKKTLVVGTGNLGKLREMEAYLSDSGWELTPKPPDLDVDETGTTFAENACLKAVEVAKYTSQWAIADDSGLSVDWLNGAPGVYSARYGNTDGERIGRLLRELGNTENRRAEFICAIAVANPQGEIIFQSEGSCEGEILYEVRGEGGFGYDPIFYVPEKKLTFAQMSPELKKSISHRGHALRQIIPQLLGVD